MIESGFRAGLTIARGMELRVGWEWGVAWGVFKCNRWLV